MALGSALVLVGGGGGGASASAPNGVEKLTADQIISKMRAAAGAASSVHVTSRGGSTTDFVMGKDAADGTITTVLGTLEVVRVGHESYFKADRAYWTKSIGVSRAALFADKYVKQSAALTAGEGSSTDLVVFFGGSLRTSGSVSKEAVTKVRGLRVITVADNEDNTLFYVALDGPPLPVEIKRPSYTEDYMDWDKAVTVPTPAPADIVDPDKTAAG